MISTKISRTDSFDHFASDISQKVIPFSVRLFWKPKQVFFVFVNVNADDKDYFLFVDVKSYP